MEAVSQDVVKQLVDAFKHQVTELTRLTCALNNYPLEGEIGQALKARQESRVQVAETQLLKALRSLTKGT